MGVGRQQRDRREHDRLVVGPSQQQAAVFLHPVPPPELGSPELVRFVDRPERPTSSSAQRVAQRGDRGGTEGAIVDARIPPQLFSVLAALSHEQLARGQ
jgi:hypothetical protein